MSGIVGSRLNNRGSGLVGSLGTDGQVFTSAGAGKSAVFEAGAIDDNAVTLAKMAGLARGKLIYGDASGDPAALAVGAADEVLTHDGTDFDWAAAGGGGKIVQYTSATSVSATAITSTSDVATNCSGAITPTSSSNKIIVTANLGMASYDNSGNCCRGRMKIYRDIGGAGFGNSIQAGSINFGHCKTETDTQERGQYGWVNICFVDSPATTSEVTYTLYGSVSSSLNITFGPYAQLQTMLLMETDES